MRGIFILLLSDSNFEKLVKGVWLCPSLYYMYKHQTSVNKERKKRYLHAIKKNKKKRKRKKESKMKINTELVGEKVPEKKSCPPFFLAFCKVYYSPQGQIFRIYIYIHYVYYIYMVSQIKSGSTMSCFIHLFFMLG